MSTETWELPTSSAAIFPKVESDRLENEENYYVWSVRMRNAFESCEMMGVVDGSETCPPDDTTNIAKNRIWKKKDSLAKAMITQCVKADLVIKVAHVKHAKESWDVFASEFSQTGSGSIMLWFRRLTKQLPSGGDVSTHVTGFQEAIRYLANAEFNIPGYIAAAILLSTLPSDPGDPHSWNQHVAGVKIDKNTTTLSSVVNGILEEKRRLTEDDKTDAQKQESALGTLEQAAHNHGKPYCRNHKMEGHSTSECRGVGTSKGKQRWPKKKSQGKKGKEKAHNTIDGGGGASGSDNKGSHLIKFEKGLTTSMVNFSQYTQCDGNSLKSPNNPEVRAYSARTAANSPTIIIDSSTTSHIHSNRADFTSLKSSSPGSINGFGDGSRTIEGRGEAQLLAQLPTGGHSCLKLQSTCLVPDSTPTLISVPRLDNADCYTLFGNGRCVTFENQDNGKLFHDALTKKKVILTGTKGPDRLYHLDTPCRFIESSYSITQSPMSKLEQLHYSLGHLNYHAIKGMVCKGLIKGITLSNKELSITPPMCPACAKGKATRASFPASKSGHADKVLGLVHSDLWGPAPVQTITGTHYVITFTDDKSRWVWVAFLKRKSDAFTAFKEWLIFVEKQTGQQLRIFRTDNGGEFITKVWRKFMKDRGIHHETTSPDTPEQNGDAEHQNRSIFDRIRTVLIDAGLPLSMFAEAVNYIVYTKNRNSTSALTNTTPYEVQFNKKPDISRLHPFGCKAYVCIHPKKRKKLSPQAIKGIFVGYADTQKAYRIYIPEKRAVICSVHVRFDVNTNMGDKFQAEGEIQFKYNSLKSLFQEFKPDDPSSDTTLDSAPSTIPSDNINPDPAPHNRIPTPIPNIPEHVPNVPPDPPARRPCQPKPPPPPCEPSARNIKSTDKGDSSRFQKTKHNSVPFPTGEPNVSTNADVGTNSTNANVGTNSTNANVGTNSANANVATNSANANVATNSANANVATNSANANVATNSANANVATNSANANVTTNSANMDISTNISESANIAHGEEPKTHRQAMASPDAAEWAAAERYELNQLARLDAYELMPLPPDRQQTGCRWVYKIKCNSDGDISLYRARLVAQGFTQRPGEDFFETFAPVAKIESIRMLLAIIAAILDWEIHVIDIDSAFINCEMPEDQTVYLSQPPGYVAEGKEDFVWKLGKALYGLKQSGHLWYQKLKGILEQIGFKACKSDPCVFIRSSQSATSIISSHVDDLGLYCDSLSEVNLLKSQIRKHVSIKDLGEIQYILGIEVIRNRKARTISISHRRYIDEVVERFGQATAKDAHSPMEMGTRLSLDQCPSTLQEIVEMRPKPYQSAVGALNHAAVMTRPDIAKAVQTVAQFSSNPGKRHWDSTIRIIRYLKTTRNWVLTLGGKSAAVELLGYCDADHANSTDHGRSISGYAMMLGNGCFSWSSKKQTATALSTGEAEYYATTHAGREVLWLRQLLTEIGFAPTIGTTLHIDNTSSIRMIETPDQVTNRTKHINIAYHWIREEVQKQSIKPVYVPSDQNISDIFTKGFHAPCHKELAHMLGMGLRADAS